MQRRALLVCGSVLLVHYPMSLVAFPFSRSRAPYPQERDNPAPSARKHKGLVLRRVLVKAAPQCVSG